MTSKKRPADDALVEMHRGASFTTQRGMASILQYVQAHGIPSAVSASSQRRARQKACQVMTPFGQITQELVLRLASGEDSTVHVLHPFALLYRTVRECPPFRSLLLETLQKYPSTRTNPWGIIIYFDEVSPTNPLASGTDERKIQSFYWTFREFLPFLSREEVWFIVSCTRSTTIEELEVGMNEMVKLVLKQCFFNEDSHHFAKSGIALDVRDPAVDVPNIVHIFAQHALTIADFLALKQLLNAMGHNGLKPCPCCRNIVKDDIADGRTLFGLSNLECARWRQHTDQSIRELHEHMRERKTHIGATAFGDLQSRLGFNYSAASIVCDATLAFKAVSTLVFDWPHVYLVNGIFGRELDAFMAFARAYTPPYMRSIVTYADLHEYLSRWTWSAHWDSCKLIFAKGKLSSTASEQLSAYPVIRKFFLDEIIGEPTLAPLHAAAESCVMICTSLELLQCASRRLIPAQELHDATIAHLRKHLEVHGTEWWVYKHHQAAHLAKMYKDHGFLPDTLVTERRHKEPKRFCMQRLGLIGYEKGLMEELALQHLHDWRKFQTVTLLNPQPLPKRLRLGVEELFPHATSLETSVEFTATSGQKYHTRDAVLLGDAHRRAMGKLWYHFNVDGSPWSCLEIWPLVRVLDERCAQFSVCDTAHYVRSTDLLSPTIYRISGGIATAILPKQYALAL